MQLINMLSDIASRIHNRREWGAYDPTKWTDKIGTQNVFPEPKGPFIHSYARAPRIFDYPEFNNWINDQLIECEVYDKYDCTPYIANALRFFYYLVENFKEEINLESYIELSLRVNFEVLFEIPKDVTNYLVGEYAELNITPSLTQRCRSHQTLCESELFYVTANDSGTESAIWHIDSILNELNAEGGKNGKN